MSVEKNDFFLFYSIHLTIFVLDKKKLIEMCIPTLTPVLLYKIEEGVELS